MPRAKKKTELPISWNPVLIENIYPDIESGRYPVKRIIGDIFHVYADVYKQGHDGIEATLTYRFGNEKVWNEIPMQLQENHRYHGSFSLDRVGRYFFKISAWPTLHSEMRSESAND